MSEEMQPTIDDATYGERFEEVYVGQSDDGYAIYDVQERT